MEIINVVGLNKKYKKNNFYSLKDINFSIAEGDIVGLVGKNGAGKSTLLKLIAKAQKPTLGNIFFKDKDINKYNNTLDSFGIMISPVFYPHLTVIENMNFFLKIHDKSNKIGNIKPTLQLVDLWNVRKRKPAGFSFGMKQRLSLALALVTDPQFVLLDEPFVGLDPVGVGNLIAILKKWSQQKQVSMIISSHQLKELEAICNRYIFIDQGRIKEDFLTNKNNINIELNDSYTNYPELIQKITDLYNVEISNNKLQIDRNIDNHAFNNILYKLSEQELVKAISWNKDKLTNLFEEK